jgi:hypothetical protein
MAKRGVKATMIIGKPIDPKSFGRKDRDGLVQAVRSAIEAPLLAQ